MFRPTAPQLALLESKFRISSEKRNRMQNSGAEIFRNRVLALIDEKPMRTAFDAQKGRPNASVRLLIGLHILKENNDLTETEVLDHREFNLQWQHALAVEPATAHVCQKTLNNFRRRLLESDPSQQLFVKTVSGAAQMDGINLHK